MTRPLTAVHSVVSLRASYGGPARSVPALCDALAARGVAVELLTIENEAAGHPLVLPRAPGVHVTRIAAVVDRSGVALSARGYRSAIDTVVGKAIALALGETFTSTVEPGVSKAPASSTASRSRPAHEIILHDHGMWRATNRAMASVARARRIALVTSTRGMAMTWSLAHHAWRKRLALALYARRDLATAHALHATSEQEAAQLRELGLRAPIAIIPNGIALPAHVAPAPPERPHRQLLFLGRIASVKGLLPLIDAWAAARLDGWRLAIAGPDEGDYRLLVNDAIRRAHAGLSVSLLGPVDDVVKWKLLAESDALVLPSVNESFGIAVAEALAAARPVIASTATPWESVAAAGCGWHVGHGDAMVESLRSLAALSDAERAAMGARGRAFAESQLAWPRVAERIEGLYRWVLGGGTAPDWVRTT